MTMWDLFKFYVNQSFRGIKKSYMVLIAMGLALSMAWATHFAIEGAFTQEFPASFTTTGDLLLQINHSNVPNASVVIQQTNLLSEDLLEYSTQSSNKEIEYQVYPYLDFKVDGNDFGIRMNNTRFLSSYRYLECNVHFLAFNISYFNSPRFLSNYHILEGRSPQSSQEVLVPYLFKEFYFYSVGDTLDMSWFIGDFNIPITYFCLENNSIQYEIEGDYQVMMLNGCIISGFYAPTQEEMELLSDPYEFYWTTHTIYEDQSVSDYIFGGLWARQTPIFLGADFSDEDINSHPILQLYSQLIANTTFYDLLKEQIWPISPSFTRVEDVFHYGVFLEIDWSVLDFQQTLQLKDDILKEFNQVTFDFVQRCTITNIFSSKLSEILTTMTQIRTLSQTVNIPLFAFSTILASLSIQAIEQTRIKDIFQLNLKGMSKKQIIRQLVVEMGIMVILSNLIGIIIGYLLFFPIKDSLVSLFFPLADVTTITVAYSPYWVLITTLIGGILIIISHIPLLKKLHETDIQDMQDFISKEHLEGGYDEQSTYSHQKDTGLQKSALNLQESRNENQKLKDHYEDSIQSVEKKIPKRSYFLMIGLVIPIFLYAVVLYSITRSVSQFWKNLVAVFYYDFNLCLVFALGIPLLLGIFGVFRFLVIESPKRFAKISRWVSKPFIKPLESLMGLEMIRRKEFRYILFLITLFSSLAFIINPIAVSKVTYPMLINNLDVGSDVQIELMYPEDSYMIPDFFQESKQQILNNISSELGVPIENSVEIYKQQYKFAYSSPTTDVAACNAFMFNFTSYQSTIKGSDIILPNTEVEINLNAVNEYLQAHSGDIIPILLNQWSWDPESWKDLEHFYLNFTYYNQSSEIVIHRWVECIVVGYVTYLPGMINLGSYYTSIRSIFFDPSTFLPENTVITSNNQIFLIDLENHDDIDENSKFILESALEGFGRYNIIRISIFDWQDYVNGWSILQTQEGYSMYSLIVIGLVLGVIQGLIFVTTTRDQSTFYADLLVRGVSKRQLFKFGVFQLGLLMILAVMMSAICSAIPLFLAIRFEQYVFLLENYYYTGPEMNLAYPVFLNWRVLTLNLGVIALFGFIIFIVFFFTKPREQYFTKLREI